MKEGAPQSGPDIEAALAERGLSVEHFEATYGLGLEELSQPVAYGEHSGYLYELLIPPTEVTDEADQSKVCPVDFVEVLSEAYRAGGLSGVEGELKTLFRLIKQPPPEISQTARDRETRKQVPPERQQHESRVNTPEAKIHKSDSKVIHRPAVEKVIAKVAQEAPKLAVTQPEVSAAQSATVISAQETPRLQPHLIHELEASASEAQSEINTVAVAVIDRQPTEFVSEYTPEYDYISVSEEVEEPVATEITDTVQAIEDYLYDLPIQGAEVEEYFAEEMPEGDVTAEEISEETDQASADEPENDEMVSQIELQDQAPSISGTILAEIKNDDPLPEQVEKQVELLLDNLPADVAFSLATYLIDAEPEEHKYVAELLVDIAAMSARLNKIRKPKEWQVKEAEFINTLLMSRYEVLLGSINYVRLEDINPVLAEAFVARVLSDEYLTPPKPETVEPKNFMHERLLGVLGVLPDGIDPKMALHLALGKYILHYSFV